MVQVSIVKVKRQSVSIADSLSAVHMQLQCNVVLICRALNGHEKRNYLQIGILSHSSTTPVPPLLLRADHYEIHNHWLRKLQQSVASDLSTSWFDMMQALYLWRRGSNYNMTWDVQLICALYVSTESFSVDVFNTAPWREAKSERWQQLLVQYLSYILSYILFQFYQ